MASGDIYTAEQLENIRKTLRSSLGDKSAQALESLESRFTAAPDFTEEDAKLERLRNTEEKQVDVDRMIELGRLASMQKALEEVKDDPVKQKKLVSAIIDHKDAKATDLAEALSAVSTRVDLVDVLVTAMIAQKGVNPLIEAMRYAAISPKAISSLARAIAEQGTVNHLIRTIGTAPRNQPDAEVVLAMEMIRKGSVEQMIEALNLLDDSSPGTVIVATGVVNRKDVGIEPLVRAMSNCKNNTKASALLSLEVTKRAEASALVTLLERYISDESDAGEILTSKLVQYSLVVKATTEDNLLLKACRQMHNDSMSGKILAMGVLTLDDIAVTESAYQRLAAHPKAKEFVGLGVFKKSGFLKATRLMGKEYFRMSKVQSTLEEEVKEARKRYHWIIKEVLGEEIKLPVTHEKKTDPPAAAQKKPAQAATAAAKKPAEDPKKK